MNEHAKELEKLRLELKVARANVYIDWEARRENEQLRAALGAARLEVDELRARAAALAPAQNENATSPS